MKQTILCLFFLTLLTGCWSNQELDGTAFVNSVGFEKSTKSDKHIQISYDIIKPSADSNGDDQSQGNGEKEHIVVEEDTETLLKGSHEIIKYTQRIPNFSHTKIWIISEKLAMEGSFDILDPIQRSQMLRLSSHAFITKDSPAKILNTPTLYDLPVTSEFSSSLDQTKYLTEYAPITLREFYKLLKGPTSNAYLPMIYIDDINNKEITAIGGTAVIKEDRMVGELNKTETTGLNLLLNQVKNGSIQVNLDEKEKASLEIHKLNTKTIPKMTGNQLEATIHVKVEGILADNMTSKELNNKFLDELETTFAEEAKRIIRSTLNKLQKELQTDITNIGHETYRKYPKQWKKFSSEWNDIFANADITIEVDTTVLHQGFINEGTRRNKSPLTNPYFFGK